MDDPDADSEDLDHPYEGVPASMTRNTPYGQFDICQPCADGHYTDEMEMIANMERRGGMI